MSPDTLAAVRLDTRWDFVRWCRPTSDYFNFFGACLYVRNPYAVYVRGLFLAFKTCDINEALLVLGTIKDIYPVGELAYYMLQSCAGFLSEKNYYELKSKYPFETIATTADALMRHIYNIGPRHCRTYSDTWHFEDFPTCWEHHEAVGEYNGQRCMDCIYFYISRDILLLS
ncbi:uncharacterized protein LOC17874425 [Capsella rubella]|nr:uncharacterized protein LOC17874425 [Capsella rubella]